MAIANVYNYTKYPFYGIFPFLPKKGFDLHQLR